MLRWLWEHRVPLVPVWVVLAVASGGLTARFVLTVPPTALPTWQVGLLAALVCLPAAAYAWRIHARWRRRWVLTLTAAAGALMTWMHTVTEQTVLPAVIAHLVLGVAVLMGRLFNLSLGERVTTEGELRDWADAAKRISYPDTSWINTRLLPGGGWTARLVWPRGAYDRDAVRRDVHKFEGARDLPVGSLRFMPVGRQRNTLDVIYIPDSPNGKMLPWPGVTRTEGLSCTDPVPLGLRDVDGTEASIVRFRKGRGERRILIGGASESGKSGVLNNLVGEDACRDDVVGLGMDLKGGVELAPWSKVLLWMIHDVNGAMEMLAALEAAAVYRQGYMREVLKCRVWPVSPELPAIHLTVDEIRKLAGSTSGRTGKQQRQLLDRMIDVGTQGRALGIGLAAAGQRLTLEATGSSQLSTQFDIRIGLRMNESDSANYIFPDEVVRLHEIPSERPGMAYLKDGERLDPQTHQGYFWSDELVAEVAELRAGGGATLDRGTGDAMAAVSPLFAKIWARAGNGDGAGDSPTAPGNGGDGGGDSPRADGDKGGERVGEAGESAGGEAMVSIETALRLLGAQAGNGEELAAAYRAGTLPDELLDVACQLTGRPRPPRVPEVFTAGDVTLADVVARNATRTGVPAPTPLVPRPRPRLSEDAARAAMRQALNEAGAVGCTARELYVAATRSSSWFHPVITAWIDDDATVLRSGHGRYVDARFVHEMADAAVDG